MEYLKRLITITVAVGTAATTSCGYAVSDSGQHKGDLEWVKHVVVIYMENHSFDILYGLWGSVNGKAVNGLANADVARMTQVNQAGVPYQCRTLKPVSFVKPIGENYSIGARDARVNDFSNAVRAAFSK